MPGTYARVFDDREVLEMLHARVKRAGSQLAFSRVTGVSREHLNKVLHGKRAFGRPFLRCSISGLFMRLSGGEVLQ
jgi:hypothetical protein